MDQRKLDRRLHSVGKEAFVKHYPLFKDYSANKISRDSAIEALMRANRSNEAGASIRLGNAKAIFDEDGHCEALLMVQMSERVPGDIARSARDIYERECGRSR